MAKKFELTTDEIKGYFAEGSKMRHCYFDTSIKMAEDMRIHADGIYPTELIECRRPNESDDVKCYREKIYVPKTEPYFTKILATLDKIRRSSDWGPRYENKDQFTRIPPEQDLEQYCEFNFPDFTSLTNWVFAVLKKEYSVDPNGVVFIYPNEVNVEPGQFLEPFPHIFNSDLVIDFVPGDYAILVNTMGCMYYDSKGGSYSGKSFYFITTERIIRYDQIDEKNNYTEAVNYPHLLNELPVYKIGAIIAKSVGKNYLFKSRFAGILPEFNEALREYSDLQAAKVLHIFPERWEYTQNECTRCKGTGKVRNPAWFVGCDAHCPQEIKCDNKGCSGGYIAAGPYSKIMVRPVQGLEAGQQQVPLPPVGEVQKNVEIVKVQEASIQAHIQYGLASINFEFINATPLNQSGTAKEVDKDELNTSVHSIAEDLVRIMDWMYWIIAKYRYRVQYPLDVDIKKMVPIVPVPERYDMLSTMHLEGQLKSAKDNNANAVIVNAIEIEYASKAFNGNPEIRDQVELVLELDPLANIPEDVKNSRLQNKGITKLTYVVSSNIQSFVQRAIESVKDFTKLDLPKQREIIEGYGTEQINAENNDLFPGEPDDVTPTPPNPGTPNPGEPGTPPTPPAGDPTIENPGKPTTQN